MAIFLVSGWLTGIVAGFISLERYESTPGKSTRGTVATILSAKGKWRFKLVVSSECPCSRASVNALKAAVDSHPDITTSEVVFVGNPDPDAWMVQKAKSIHDCTVTVVSKAPDGAQTSGQTYLYNPEGRLVYSGGITQGRGVDDSRFAMNLTDSILAHKPLPKSGPVFGCELTGVTR